MTTRFAGELRLDEPQIASPRRPESPMTERVEVTQPYIPAIRETPPDFARRLNGDAPSRTAPTERPRSAPAQPDSASVPSAEPEPTSAASAGGGTSPPAEKDAAAPADTTAPPKRRSLVRRVVRKIIGPDLLRKDPAPRGR